MKKESRLGPAVRDRTKLLAALMRTPDDGLLAFAQANDLSERIDVKDLQRVRDALDALGCGLSAPPTDPFWSRLDAVLSALEGQAEVASAPIPPPPAAVVSQPIQSNPDFRHEVMEKNPGVRKPAAPGKRGRGWKPSNPKVRPPAPDQEQTALLETGNAGTLKLTAATTTRDWPLKKVTRLQAAYAAYSDHGDPSIEEICQFFDLPNERAVRIALSVWERRIADDEELADEHASLLQTLDEDDG